MAAPAVAAAVPMTNFLRLLSKVFTSWRGERATVDSPATKRASHVVGATYVSVRLRMGARLVRLRSRIERIAETIDHLPLPGSSKTHGAILIPGLDYRVK